MADGMRPGSETTTTGRRGRGGYGTLADVAGAMEQGLSPVGQVVAQAEAEAGGAGAGGPGGQQVIGCGGGFWQKDDNGVEIGGRSTSTPAARAGVEAGGGGDGPGRQQEVGGGGGGGDGGAAEEIDRDGANDGGRGP